MALMTSQALTERTEARAHGRIKPGTAKYTSIYIFLGIYALFIDHHLRLGRVDVAQNQRGRLAVPALAPSVRMAMGELSATAWDGGSATMFKNSMFVAGFGTSSAS